MKRLPHMEHVPSMSLSLCMEHGAPLSGGAMPFPEIAHTAVWSIGTRVVWHLLRVSPGAPANLACEGRVACLNGLVRGACQPRFVEAALGTHTHPAAFVAGARHVPVGWTALVECVSPTKKRTVSILSLIHISEPTRPY